jgi:hypothetical protein
VSSDIQTELDIANGEAGERDGDDEDGPAPGAGAGASAAAGAAPKLVADRSRDQKGAM